MSKPEECKGFQPDPCLLPINDEESVNPEEQKKILEGLLLRLKTYLFDHPEILYKGVPLIWLIYMSSPVLIFFWAWLPWIWVGYEITNRIPVTMIPSAITALRKILG